MSHGAEDQVYVVLPTIVMMTPSVSPRVGLVELFKSSKQAL